MKNLLLFIVTNLLAIIFAIGGIILAYHGVEGWGWCFFLALIVYESTPKFFYSKKLLNIVKL